MMTVHCVVSVMELKYFLFALCFLPIFFNVLLFRVFLALHNLPIKYTIEEGTECQTDELI